MVADNRLAELAESDSAAMKQILGELKAVDFDMDLAGFDADALAGRVQEDLTPSRFWTVALQTGRTVRLAPPHDSLELGTLAAPIALIEALETP